MPLLSRAADPLLGVFTGVLAYYLFETNPRTAPSEQDRLQELIKWKRAKTASAEEAKLKQEEELRTLQSVLAQVERK